MSAHLSLEGRWMTCERGERCKLPFHLEMTPAEAAAIPLVTLLPLFEAAQPYSEVQASTGAKLWRGAGRNRLHREYGLPAAVHPNGTLEWFVNGEYHRLGAPALIFDNGDKRWYVNGKLHREDGPAKTWVNGEEEWWIRGRELTTDTQIRQWQAHRRVMAERS